MAGQLSTNYGVTIDQAGEYPVKKLSSSKPVYARRSPNGQIDHIGIRLFDRQMMEKQGSPIFLFVERYLLELMLADSDAAVQERLRMEHVKLSSDLPMSGSYNKALRPLVDAFSDQLSLYLSQTGNRYILSCRNGQQTVLSLEFPTRYELIAGFTKLEAENSIYQEIIMHKPAPSAEVSASLLSEKNPGVYTANEDYYMMEDIVSTRYYEKTGDSYRPIFASNKLVESICNLFNSDIDYGAMAEVNQSLYGNKNHTYKLPLRQLTSFLQAQKCTLYTTIQRIEKDKIYGAVMAINQELGYQHLLTFTLEKAIIPQIKNQQISIKMFSYVPIHNLSSIIEGNK